jgi:hypothetical protein
MLLSERLGVHPPLPRNLPLQQPELPALESQQLLFERNSPTKSDEASVAPNHPMARHDNRNRIRPVSKSHRANGLNIANSLGQFPVRNRLSVGNFQQGMPHANLEGSSLQNQREIESPKPACKVSVQLRNNFRKWRGTLRPFRFFRPGPPSLYEMDLVERLGIAHEPQQTYGRSNFLINQRCLERSFGRSHFV